MTPQSEFAGYRTIIEVIRRIIAHDTVEVSLDQLLRAIQWRAGKNAMGPDWDEVEKIATKAIHISEEEKPRGQRQGV